MKELVIQIANYNPSALKHNSLLRFNKKKNCFEAVDNKDANNELVIAFNEYKKKTDETIKVQQEEIKKLKEFANSNFELLRRAIKKIIEGEI